MRHKKKWQMVYITSATSTTSLYNKPQTSNLNSQKQTLVIYRENSRARRDKPLGLSTSMPVLDRPEGLSLHPFHVAGVTNYPCHERLAANLSHGVEILLGISIDINIVCLWFCLHNRTEEPLYLLFITTIS